jgi:predicted ATPase/DNA-binding SARP family transcriptional activator
LASLWKIELFGGLRAIRNDQIVNRFRTQKTASLLAYLAFHSHRSHPREELIELLWPEHAPQLGRRSLRTALSSLRHQLERPNLLPGSVLIADRHSVQLNPKVCRTDVHMFEATLGFRGPSENDRDRIERLMEAVEVYRGELLPGFFDAWILPERQRLAEMLQQGLRELTGLLEHEGDLPQALRWARRAVAVDPLREESHRRLIRLLIRADESAAARRQLAELERLLAEELAVEPAAETYSLLEELRPAGRETTSVSDKPLIAPASQSSAAGAGPGASARPPGFLPRFLNRLLGREREVAELKRLLTDPDMALVTITGTGGIGKTRLAVEAAATLCDTFPDGRFLVDLAPLRDPSLVVSTIARSLGVRGGASQSLTESLKEWLRSKQLLLLLDNFEHLLPAALLVAELLASCPLLKVLVTSRAPLHLRGEQEFSVPPLALPDLRHLPLVEVLSRCAAVELFIQRARSVTPDFALTEENAAAVAEICRSLDGLPLAIELAAARIKVLPPQALLSRLERRLPLLTDGARDLPARQQTLRDAIAWSYDLLGEEEQTLFRRLSVLIGGCTLEAAEAVGNAGHELGTEILDGIASLVDKSLLQQETVDGGEPRFRMLETIREFGMERLAKSGEEAAIRQRHACYFVVLAEEPPQRFDVEHDNYRAVLD